MEKPDAHKPGSGLTLGSLGASMVTITQATTATFADMYFRHTFLFFIHKGAKRVVCPQGGEMLGEVGDVMVFPPGSMVAMENRPVLDHHYRATGVCFSADLVGEVFPSSLRGSSSRLGIQHLKGAEAPVAALLEGVQKTLHNFALPPAVARHRLLEPLIWLRHLGVQLPTSEDNSPLGRVRAVIEMDIGRSWKAKDVAEELAMSEATMRRWLVPTGMKFSAILRNTRLERGLALLQTTDHPVSVIALDCGFSTPSHFTTSFKERFGIRPSQIRAVED